MELTGYETINQQRAYGETSSKYAFIPTTEAITALNEAGWLPVKAQEARVVKEEKTGFQAHIVTFRNEAFDRNLINVGDAIPELKLYNSHDGTGAFKLFISILEKVCLNGLVVENGTLSDMRVSHIGYAKHRMLEAVRNVQEFFPVAFGQRAEWQDKNLSREQQEAFAKAAIELRWDGEKYAVEPRELLQVRHSRQSTPTLWNTYNVIQENIIKGGVRQRSKESGLSRSRRVTSLKEDVRINKALWVLAEEMAKIA